MGSVLSTAQGTESSSACSVSPALTLPDSRLDGCSCEGKRSKTTRRIWPGYMGTWVRGHVMYLPGLRSKAPRGRVTPWVVPNPVCTYAVCPYTHVPVAAFKPQVLVFEMTENS